MEIDNKLTFSKQLSNVRKKWINNQFKTFKNTNRNIYIFLMFIIAPLSGTFV